MSKPKNAFEEESVKKAKLIRNRFDMSHFNNMTMQMGKFYPNLCIEALPTAVRMLKLSCGRASIQRLG